MDGASLAALALAPGDRPRPPLPPRRRGPCARARPRSPGDRLGPARGESLRLGAGAMPLALDHVPEQLDHGGVAADLYLPALVGVDPVLQRAVLRELVEVRPGHRDVDAGVGRRVPA